MKKIPSQFDIEFRELKTNNSPSINEHIIEKIFKELLFSWFDKYNGYFFACYDTPSVFEKFSALTERLNNINNAK